MDGHKCLNIVNNSSTTILMKVGVEINLQSAIGGYLHNRIVGLSYFKINQNTIKTDLFQS